MSVLLSAYYPEGIVFAADKNLTITTTTGERYTKPTATKVLTWPHKNALVGFVGLGILAGLPMDEWLRIFIAGTRDFTNIDELAQQLRDQIQRDFDTDFPPSQTLPSQAISIIHLGGFADRNDIQTPVMYHIWNHAEELILDPINPYPPAERTFRISEDLERDFRGWPHPEDYPERVRERLQNQSDQGRFTWFNNSIYVGAFNVFKGHVWRAIESIEREGLVPIPRHLRDIDRRVAYCQMAIEMYGSFFTYHFLPQERSVGGGVDVESIPWPV